MADKTCLPSAVEVTSFRLVLSDAEVEGGQRVKTLPISAAQIASLTIESIVGMLGQNLGFNELVAARKLSLTALKTGSGGLTLVGNDGSRHVPIRSDEQLVAFFTGIRNSKLPSLEAKLAPPGAMHKAAAREAPCNKGKAAKDRVEDLEDTNFRMSKSTQRLQMSVEEIERTASADREEVQRLTTVTNKELGAKIDANQRDLAKDTKSLKDTVDKIRLDNEALRKTMASLERKSSSKEEKMQIQLEGMNKMIAEKFDDLQNSMQILAKTDEDLGIENQRLNAELQKHVAELKRVEESNVQKEELKGLEDAISKRFSDEVSQLRAKLSASESELRDRMTRQQADLEEMFGSVKGDFVGTTERLDAALKKLDEDMRSGISEATSKLSEVKNEVEGMVSSEIDNLATSVNSRFHEVMQSSRSTQEETTTAMNELRSKTEATFAGVAERMENLVTAERSRLGTIEKDTSEGIARLRSDCRMEVERIRIDYEQEASRLDADMSDLHMKHDVLKQEINFFQSRLVEQRDWSQRQLAETATATRAAQIDAQEGVAAATKMAHALRDDQIAFKDRMGKHVSVLQHASDSYGNAINSLETQRSRMRLELDAILADHTEYVTDMDGWADDVRVKVERLFRALEPPRCAWRISGALAKIKDMKKPLAMRSPSFTLQGLREVQVELYPHGTNQSPDGKAVIRLCMPPKANVRYQVWLGRLSDGPREYESGGCLSVDLMFDSWKDQIQDDGSLLVTMEILQDLTSIDESLARAVNLET